MFNAMLLIVMPHVDLRVHVVLDTESWHRRNAHRGEDGEAFK